MDRTFICVREADVQGIISRLDRIDQKIQPLVEAQRPVVEDDIIDGKAAAKLLKVSASTIYRLVQSKQLPEYNAGKGNRYLVSDVKALLTKKNIE
ncbi:helix-turn-helix domain-containing protein [Alistipes sp.]|uniref:helix-turn-helix domain-containing protein n=1 Tax=Alistipes sp. TaxID=1872444 RepID=UPI003AB7E9D7